MRAAKLGVLTTDNFSSWPGHYRRGPIGKSSFFGNLYGPTNTELPANRPPDLCGVSTSGSICTPASHAPDPNTSSYNRRMAYATFYDLVAGRRSRRDLAGAACRLCNPFVSAA